MSPQVGIPLFYLQELAGAQLRFKDNFADSEKHWTWRLFKGAISEIGKNGVEENGYYELSIGDTKDGRWDSDDNEAPRLFIEASSFPCEVITRLDYFENFDDGYAGLFVSHRPTSHSTNGYFAIVRKKTATTDGIAVINTAQTIASYLNNTLPVWFRLRIGCGSYGALHVYFDYSYDGVNWTNLYIQSEGVNLFNEGALSVGLFCANFTSMNSVVSRFDFFKMQPKSAI